MFLEIWQNLQENKCARVSFFDKVAGLSHFFVVAQRHHKEVLKACNFIKKETFAQELSYEFCEISKNTFYYITLLVAASYERKTTETFATFDINPSKMNEQIKIGKLLSLIKQ